MSNLQTYETHLKFGAHSALFHDFVLRNSDLVAGMNETGSSLEQDIGMYRYNLQPLPMLAGGEGLREFQRAVVSVCSLLKTLPQRFFSNDAESLRKFYGFQEKAAYASLQFNSSLLSELLCRMDLIYTPDGFKAIEANFSAYLGGWQTSLREAKIRNSDLMGSFCSDHPFQYQNPSPLICALQHIITASAHLSSTQELHLFFAFPFDISPEISQFVNHFFQTLLAKLRPGWTGKLFFGSLTDLTPANQTLVYDAKPIHALALFYDTELPPFLEHAHHTHQLQIFNPPSAQFLRDKRNFALLSEHQDSSLFSKDEQKIIQAFVPWTRLLKPGKSYFRGNPIRIPEDIIRTPEPFLLKKGQSSKGADVFLGCQMDAAAWRDTVSMGLDSGDFIVQERLDSAPFLFFHQNQAVAHNAVWGGFCFGSNYGGGQLRVTPCDEKNRIINADKGANVAPLWELT